MNEIKQHNIVEEYIQTYSVNIETVLLVCLFTIYNLQSTILLDIHLIEAHVIKINIFN